MIIEIFRDKNADELSKCIADPKCNAESGSAAAMTAALAASLALRAACDDNNDGLNHTEEYNYIIKNVEIIRGYMVRLIDEDVKCRGPLRRAFKEGETSHIEAARQIAGSINAEIINMMGKLLELEEKLCDYCTEDSLHFIYESVQMALAANKTAESAILANAKKCSDPTFVFVTRRENELTTEIYLKTAQTIIEKTKIKL